MPSTQATARKSLSFRHSLAAGLLLGVIVLGSNPLIADDGSVRGTVRFLHSDGGYADSADVVVSLTPVEESARLSPGPPARLIQKDKKFVPHILAITQGTKVVIPNQDVFFHNLSTIHQGKTSDLGLYQSGSTRKVRFKRPGVSYIFCNIHPQMSAVVVVLRTRHFALTDAEGKFQISGVPPGRYKLALWHELTPEAELRSQEREVNVAAGNNDIGQIVLHTSDAPKDDPKKDVPYKPSDRQPR